MESIAVPAVLSSTLILVRQNRDKYQVYLLKRSAKSGFMPGNYVFPGGKVDPCDQDTKFWLNHVDLIPDDIPDRLGGDHDLNRIIAAAVAAIRETFEEAGVLLSVKRSREILAHAGSASTAADLEAARPNGFRSIVEKTNTLLAFSNLFRWSHWKTPVYLKKRFDTFFFVAVMPREQHARPDNHEATHGIWISPMQALKANLDGSIALSPPTLVTLHQLLAYDTFKKLIAATTKRRWGNTIMPRMIPYNRGVVIIEPWDSQYHDETISLDRVVPEKNNLSAGDRFSRLWLKDGVCRPIDNI